MTINNTTTNKMTINQTMAAFVQRAITDQLVDPMDEIYLRNRLMAILGLYDYQPESESHSDQTLVELLDSLAAYAQAQGMIDGSQKELEIFEAAVMDLVTPLASELNRRFWSLYKESPMEASNYFYHLSQANDYIKTRNIARNISFMSPSDYGDLEITINLSKPEKNPKDIAKAKTAVSSAYPKCPLCMENEGYEGHANHAARQNHRIVRLPLNGERYGLQYSPYVYYNEHSIILHEDHIPMKVDLKCFRNLLAFVDLMPHYFAGSNADLPIVGGSILSHDHYQGGRHVFPMEKAQAYRSVSLATYNDISVDLVNWPMSVIRLRGDDWEEIAQAADYILTHWREYSDKELGILAYSGETAHNTITPIARRKGQAFEMDLVLRNNRQDEAHPDGIFHPHPDVQNIKKENIGLIEVMGLAILPARLLDELQAVESYFDGQSSLDDILPIHQAWAEEYRDKAQGKNGRQLLEDALGQTFARILEDAGVYKLNEEGKAGMMRFIDHLNRSDSTND